MNHEFEGPYFYPGLIGADGKLSRLHKGGKVEKAEDPIPPVRESNADVQQASVNEREKARLRRGYNQTLLGAADQPGTKTLLG